MAAALSGCQHTSQTLARLQPWKQRSASPQQLSLGVLQTHLAADLPADKPLTPEMKADVQMAAARSLEKQGKSGAAMEAYRVVLRHDPSRADACQRLAVLYTLKGDNDEADRYYQRAIRLDTENPEYYTDYGYSLYLQGRWQEAEARLRYAIALQKDFARAHTNLGLILARTGRYDEALAAFAYAGCTEAEARANLAHGMAMQRHWAMARQQCALALASRSGSAELDQRISRLQTALAQAHQSNTMPMGQAAGHTPAPLGSVGAVGQASFLQPTSGPSTSQRPPSVRQL
jgi:Tfp pilus assembly protein PilF